MQPSNISSDRLAFRVDEFCAVTRISRSTLYKLMREGKIRTVRVAGRRLIPAEAARALLQGEAA
jgi:excisionase family DNA binding protein